MGEGGLLLIQVKVAAMSAVMKISIAGCRRDWAVMYNTLWTSGGWVLFHVALTRGQTGLTVTQVALLLRDADVWVGSGKEWLQ